MSTGVLVLVVSALAVLALPPLVGALALVLRHREHARSDGMRAWSEAETRMMQGIHKGLKHMEERVQSLETLLLDRRRQAGPGEHAGKGADL